MRVRTWLAVALGLVCLSAAQAQSDILAQVAAEVREGKVSGPALLERYNALIRREPRNPQYYCMAAAVNDNDSSRALYEKALAVDPNYLPARIGLARYFMRRYEIVQAYPVFRKLTASMASDPKLRL